MKYIRSRLHKATVSANKLRSLLEASDVNASDRDFLEAAAYAALCAGTEFMEKHDWEKSLPQFCLVNLIFKVLENKFEESKHKELLSSVVEPSLRFSAYNLGIPRSVDATSISRKWFPKEDTKVKEALERLDPEIFNEEVKKEESAVNAVTSITWRGRTANVEVADVANALGSAAGAEKDLETYLSEHKSSSGKEQAKAFDGILLAWQDAQDAVKNAIGDLRAEKVEAQDPRLQKLQITFTYVSYNLIGWRVARDRIMSEGIVEAAKGGKLSGMKELVALYDAILRSVEQIEALPGVAMDRPFAAELKAKKDYFRALKCLAISKSHSLLEQRANALALLAKALTLIQNALPVFQKLPLPEKVEGVKGLNITVQEVDALKDKLTNELTRAQALAEIEKLTSSSKTSTTSSIPLVDRLETYPEGEIDTKNLVKIPPTVEPIPVKPIFFDIAWNYINYPGQEKAAPENREDQQETKGEEGKKKGFFGLFGR